MTVVYRNLFTAANDTSVETVAPDIGSGFMLRPAGVLSAVVTSNRARRAAGDTYSQNLAPALEIPADYAVRGVGRVVGGSSSDAGFSLYARRDGNSWYQLYYEPGFLAIRRRVDGANTWIASTTGWSPTVGVDYLVTLECVGSTIRALIDDEEVLAVEDGDLTAVGVAGFEAVYYSGSSPETEGWHWDAFEIDTLGGSGEPELTIDEQPTATQSGYLIDPAPVVHVLDAEGALNTSFTGDVTVSLLGSGGVLLGTLTVAAVAGVATFSNLRPCEAGTYQLRFAASGYANLDSAVFEVTAGEGSTVIFTEEAPMRPIRRNEATANLRDIPITILASDGSPWDGDPDEGAGVKAQLSVNFGTETPSPANIVKLSAGNFRVRPTDAYTDIAEGSLIKARVPAAAGRREAIGWAHIIPADTYVSAEAARKALVDAVVIASDGGNGYNVVKQPESNQIQRTIPDVGVITITATFSPTVPGLVSAGGS